MSNESQIRRLLDQIDLEYQAAWLGLSGIATGTSTHQFINASLRRIEKSRAELVGMLGEDEAGRLIVEQLEKSSDQPKENSRENPLCRKRYQ